MIVVFLVRLVMLLLLYASLFLRSPEAHVPKDVLRALVLKHAYSLTVKCDPYTDVSVISWLSVYIFLSFCQYY